MTPLTRCARERADEMPPVLTSAEVDGVLSGALSPPPPPPRRPRPAAPQDGPSGPGYVGFADSAFGPQPTSTAALPDPRVWVQRFAVALLECLEGRRSPTQLARHLDQETLARINRRYRTALRRGVRPGHTIVRRVRVSHPRDGVAEAAVVARLGGRPTPIALRLLGLDGRWVVSVLEML